MKRHISLEDLWETSEWRNILLCPWVSGLVVLIIWYLLCFWQSERKLEGVNGHEEWVDLVKSPLHKIDLTFLNLLKIDPWRPSPPLFSSWLVAVPPCFCRVSLTSAPDSHNVFHLCQTCFPRPKITVGVVGSFPVLAEAWYGASWVGARPGEEGGGYCMEFFSLKPLCFWAFFYHEVESTLLPSQRLVDAPI